METVVLGRNDDRIPIIRRQAGRRYWLAGLLTADHCRLLKDPDAQQGEDPQDFPEKSFRVGPFPLRQFGLAGPCCVVQMALP